MDDGRYDEVMGRLVDALLNKHREGCLIEMETHSHAHVRARTRTREHVNTHFTHTRHTHMYTLTAHMRGSVDG